MSVQEALDVRWEVDARDVISQALCQHWINEGVFASGTLAILYKGQYGQGVFKRIRTLRLPAWSTKTMMGYRRQCLGSAAGEEMF